MSKKQLIDFSNNSFSQFGEDGIINKIFSVIGIENMACCEFGAADGFYFSNTANLFMNGWHAILIESRKEQYDKMIHNVKEYNCTPLNYSVGINHDADSLDYIFTKEKLNQKMDLLSIDIDGNDYYILDSLKNIDANVIICEHNPTIPYYMDMYADYRNNFGCSVAALNRVAANKEYFLVCTTITNCFFVKNKFKSLFDDYETDIDKMMHPNNAHLKHIITNYDGDYMVVGPMDSCYGIRSDLTEHINVPLNNVRMNHNVFITPTK